MDFKHYSLFIGLIFFLASCAGIPPVKEYSFSHLARSMAHKFEAQKHAPKSYKKAEALYKQGQSFFERRLYGAAQESFEQSLELFERAENLARWKKSKKDSQNF